MKVEVGDRIKVEADEPYREVNALTTSYVWSFDLPYRPHEIIDVYTKADQEANGALIQMRIFDRPDYLRRYEPIVSLKVRDGHPYYFLSDEAIAELGEFRPMTKLNEVEAERDRSLQANREYAAERAELLAKVNEQKAALRRVEALTHRDEPHNGHASFEGEPECPACWVASIRDALNGVQ